MQKYTQAAKVAGLLITAILPLGCAHRSAPPPAPISPLVGTWQGQMVTPHGTTLQSTFTFAADGQETMASQLHTNGQSLNVGSTGTYVANKTEITQTITAATINGKPVTLSHGSQTETDQYTLHGSTLIVTKPGSPSPFVLTRQSS